MQLLLTIVSALLYAASFLRATVLWPFCFVFMLPLLHLSLHSARSALALGVLWGTISYALTLSALLVLLMRELSGSLALFSGACLLFYFVTTSAAWFGVTYVLGRFFAYKNAWFVSSLTYFSFMYSGFLYGLIGKWQGYLLAFPLIPLGAWPASLYTLSFIGWFGVLTALLVFQLGISVRNKVLVVVACLPFLYSSFFSSKQFYYHWYDQIVAVPFQVQGDSAYSRAHAICFALEKTIRSCLQARVLVLPESVFPYVLPNCPWAVSMWSVPLEDRFLIIPAHYQQANYLYNSVFIVHKSRIIFRYDKKELVPFFEKRAEYALFLKENQFIRKEKQAFTQGAGNAVWRFDDKEIHFCVCSELLWNFSARPGACVIAAVNDGCYISYFADLLELSARFRAAQHQLPVMYSAWTRAGWIF